MTAGIIPLYNLGGVDWPDSQAIYHAQAHQGQPGLNILWPLQPYVCIGRFQDLEAEIDLQECQRRGLPVVRREVGGGAVYLDAGQVFYQLVLPRQWLAATYDYRWLFRQGLDAVALALKRMGINANVRGANDVAVGRRKISGNGAGEVGQAAVVVGNILLRFDYEAMAAVLRVPDEKFRDKAYHSMRDNLVTLEELGQRPSNEQVADMLAQAFSETLPAGLAAQPAAALPADVAALLPETAARLTAADWLDEVHRERERRRLRIRQGLEMREQLWKAPGGLLRCHCAIDSQGGAPRLTWVSLSGDFFVHPAAALGELEQALTGVPLAQVKEVAARFLAQPGVALPGVRPEDIEHLLLPGGTA